MPPPAIAAPLVAVVLTLLAGPAPEGDLAIDAVVAGASGFDLHVALGPPVASERDATLPDRPGRWREDFTLPAEGLERVSAWYDDEGVVLAARIVTVRELVPLAAELLFDLRGGAARRPGHPFATAGDEPTGGVLRSYRSEGVHLFVQGGVVREIWRTAPGAPPADLAPRLGAAWPRRDLEPAEEQPADPEEWVDLGDLIDDLPEALEGWPVTLGDEAADGGVSGAGPPTLLGERAPARAPALQVGDALAIGQPGVTLELDDTLQPVVVVTAPLWTVGLAGQELIVDGYLSPLTGAGFRDRPLAAAPGTPAPLVSPAGELRPLVTLRLDADLVGGVGPPLAFPLRHLASATSSGTFAVTYEVRGGGLMAYDTTFAVVPGPDLRPTGTLPHLDAGDLRLEPGEQQGFPGLLGLRHVEAVGALGKTVQAVTTLRRLDGAHVLADAGHTSFAFEHDGGFYALGSGEPLYESTRWDAFQNFLPWSALDLPAGDHVLVVRDHLSVGPLGQARERVVRLTVPAHRGKGGKGGQGGGDR